MGVINVPFAIPNIRIENPEAIAHTRIGWFRSVSNIPHAFAVQSFVAELAAAAGRDPKDFLLEVIGPARVVSPQMLSDTWNHGESPERYPVDTGRLRRVAELAAKEAGWGRSLPKGSGLGANSLGFVSGLRKWVMIWTVYPKTFVKRVASGRAGLTVQETPEPVGRQT